MSNVIAIRQQNQTINAPTHLRDLPIWLIWRLEDNPGKKKPLKVPYYAKGGKRVGVQGRPEDRAQMVNFETALAAAQQRNFTGVGLAPLDGEFTVLDFDECVIDGKLLPEVEAMVAGTYAEYSPSGTGVHAVVLGNMTGNNKSIANKEQFGLEAFSTKGFVTFTGNTLEITELTGCEDMIAEAGKELTDLVRLRFGDPAEAFQQTAGNQEPLGISVDVIQEALEVLDTELHYDHWLMVGMAIHHETNGEGFDLWDEWSRKSAKYSTPEYGQARWDSFGRNPNRQVTIRTLIQLANSCGARISLNALSVEDFDALDVAELVEEIAIVKPNERKDVSFQVLRWDEFARQTNSKYLIKGILPAAGLGVLYGESGSGKSFVTLDMAVSIARGVLWREKRTTQGRVIYVVAEGAVGFRNRLIAYARHYGINPSEIPLDFIDATPNLLDVKHAKAICAAISESGEKPSLIVVDTLAQTMAGANENASEDMGIVLRNCRNIYRATNAMVLLVHHSGKDTSRGARGWSGLRAAADVELEVTRSGDSRVLRTTKQKDGSDYLEYGFSLKVVPLDEDQDGDLVTSCVAIEAEIQIVERKSKKPARNEVTINKAVLHLLEDKASISIKELLDYAEVPNLSESPDKTYRQSLKKAFNNILDRGDAAFEMVGNDHIRLVTL